MQVVKIEAGKAVQIAVTRAAGEQSGFNFFLGDQTTGGWSPIGPRQFYGEGRVDYFLQGDPRLAAKPYVWYMGVDQVTISGGSGIITVTAEIDAPANKTIVHIYQGIKENTTITFTFT
jgi:hypothetical protein